MKSIELQGSPCAPAPSSGARESRQGAEHGSTHNVAHKDALDAVLRKADVTPGSSLHAEGELPKSNPDIAIAEARSRHLLGSVSHVDGDRQAATKDATADAPSATDSQTREETAISASDEPDEAENALSAGHSPSRRGRAARGRHAGGKFVAGPDETSELDDGVGGDLITERALQPGETAGGHRIVSKGKGQRARKMSGQDRFIAGPTEEENFIGGAGAEYTDRVDRAYYLMMVAGSAAATPRPPALGRQHTLSALRPRSRAECERRCGADGSCDPSNVLGCGGEHCGRKDLDI